MLKDAIISALAAALIMKSVPWSGSWTEEEKIGLYIGITGILIIFCLFLDEMVHKRQECRDRKEKIRKIVEGLKNGKSDQVL